MVVNMRIAVPFDAADELIFEHFGHCESFKLYETQGEEIVSEELVSPQCSGHQAMADFLQGLGVDALICGGIGEGAVGALAAAGIKVCGGIRGYADAAVEALCRGILAENPEPCCAGHEEGCGGECGCHGDGQSCSCSCQ